MKPIRCIFGKHLYKPSDAEVYFAGEENGMLKYRAIHKCINCGQYKETIFKIPKPIR